VLLHLGRHWRYNIRVRWLLRRLAELHRALLYDLWLTILTAELLLLAAGPLALAAALGEECQWMLLLLLLRTEDVLFYLLCCVFT